MDIIYLPFEQKLIVELKGEKVEILTFETLEHGNIKFGITAPRTISVHREEIHASIRSKATQQAVLEEELS